MPAELEKLAVVGNYYRSVAAQKSLKFQKNGDIAVLTADLYNAYVENAYKVYTYNAQAKGFSNGLTHVGFVPKHQALKLTNAMKGLKNYKNASDYIIGEFNYNSLGEYSVIPKYVIGASDLDSFYIAKYVKKTKPKMSPDYNYLKNMISDAIDTVAINQHPSVKNELIDFINNLSIDCEDY